MRKLYPVVLALLLSLAIPACKSGNDDDDTGPVGNDDDTVEPNDDDTVDPGPRVDDAYFAGLRQQWPGDPSSTMGFIVQLPESGLAPAVLWGPDEESLVNEIPMQEVSIEGTYFTLEDPEAKLRDVSLYRAQIDGLDPQTTYSFQLIEGDRISETRTFSTAPAKGSRVPVRFIVYGDNRGPLPGVPSPQYPLIAERMRGETVDFLLNTGDVTANALQSEWEEFYRTSRGIHDRVPVLHAYGNHDDGVDLTWAAHHLYPFDNAETMEFSFSYDYANIHLVSLNTEWNAGREAHRAWLEADLPAAEADPDTDWIILFYHKPAFSSSSTHGSDGSVQSAVVDLNDRYGVDINFEGHDHTFEETHFLYGLNDIAEDVGGVGAAEICETDCERGTKYIVTGGGGAPLYRLIDPLPAWSAGGARMNHYLNVAIDGDEIQIDVIDEDGAVYKTISWTRID